MLLVNSYLRMPKNIQLNISYLQSLVRDFNIVLGGFQEESEHYHNSVVLKDINFSFLIFSSDPSSKVKAFWFAPLAEKEPLTWEDGLDQITHKCHFFIYWHLCHFSRECSFVATILLLTALFWENTHTSTHTHIHTNTNTHINYFYCKHLLSWL